MNSPELIQNALNPAEKVVWQGQPEGGIILKSSDIFAVPFSLMWGGFAIFWEYSVVSSDTPIFMKLWGIPFVLVGLYLMIGRFFYESYIRKNTWYAVTNQRIIIGTKSFGNDTIKTLNLKTLVEIELVQHSDNRGSIIFGSSMAFQKFIPFPVMGRQTNLPPSFERIENAKRVYQLIQQQQAPS